MARVRIAKVSRRGWIEAAVIAFLVLLLALMGYGLFIARNEQQAREACLRAHGALLGSECYVSDTHLT